jgi:hypothetical protein
MFLKTCRTSQVLQLQRHETTSTAFPSQLVLRRFLIVTIYFLLVAGMLYDKVLSFGWMSLHSTCAQGNRLSISALEYVTTFFQKAPHWQIRTVKAG